MARGRPRGARTWQFIRPAAHARDHGALASRRGFLPRSSHKFRFGHAVGPAVWLGSARVVRTKRRARAAPEANCHFFAQSTIAIRPAGSRPAGFYPPKLYIQCLRPNCHPAEPVVRSHLAPPERHVMRPLPLPAPSGNPSGRGFSLTGRDPILLTLAR